MTAARWIAVALGLTAVVVLSVAAGGLIARQLKATPPPAVAAVTPTPEVSSALTIGPTPSQIAASLPPSPAATSTPLPPPTASLARTLEPTPIAGLDPASVEEFTHDLASAIRDHNTDYLNARLHKATIDRYGAGMCRRYVAAIPASDPRWQILSTSGPAEWSYVTDETETVIPDAWTVSVSQPAAEPHDLHFAPLDGTWRWFTDCTPTTQ